MAAPAALASLFSKAGTASTTVGRVAQVGNLFSGVKNSMPKMEEEIDVRVWGGPKSTKLRLYRLAMAIVWGKIQRRDGLRILPPAGILMLEYNLESNSVRVVCRQVTTYTAALLGRLRGRREIELFQGPPSETKGGEWAFTSILPGTPGAPGIEPKNGFEGRTILTSNPTYSSAAGTKVSRSPTPPGDSISRGVATVARDPQVAALDPVNWNNRPDYLLWAALSEPCSGRNLNTPVYNTPPPPPPVTPAPTYPPAAPEPDLVPTQYVVEPPPSAHTQTPTQLQTGDSNILNPFGQ